MVQVLLITSSRQGSWIDSKDDLVVKRLHEFVATVQQVDDNIELAFTSLDRLEFSISADKVQIFDSTTKRDVGAYDVVHVRGVHRDMGFYADYAKAVALYVEHHGKIFIDREDVGAAFGKLSQAVLFALHDIPVPQTYAQWNGSDLSQFVRAQKVEFPLIAKASMGTMGSDNYLVQTQEELAEVLGSAREPFVVQEMVTNDGDYRVLWLGEARPLIFWRPRIEGSHLSNTSQGSVPDKDVELDSVALRLAGRVRDATNRIVVGVDIMQNNQSGDWVVLEANTNPALATGSFNNEKAANYVAMIKGIV